MLRQYIASMTKNVDEAYRVDVSSQDADRLIAIADDTFLNLTLYLQLVRSGQTVDTMEKLSNTDLLGLFLDKLKSIYCEKLFNNAIQVLMVILTAKEPLSLHEISALSGRGEPDLMLLAYLKDLAPLMKCDHITEHRNCNTYFSSNEDYGNYLKGHYQDEYEKMLDRYMNMLLDFGMEHKHRSFDDLPDELNHLRNYFSLYEKNGDNFELHYSDGYENRLGSYRGMAWDFITKNKIISFDELPDEICYLGAYIADYYSLPLFHFNKTRNVGRLGVHTIECYSSSQFTYENIKDLDLLRSCIEIILNVYRNLLQSNLYSSTITVQWYMLKRIKKICLFNTELNYYNIDDALESLDDYLMISKLISKKISNSELDYSRDQVIVSLKKAELMLDTEEALLYYNKGINEMEKLFRQGLLYDLNDLASAYMKRGQILQLKGKCDKSSIDYGKCIQIRENLKKQSMLCDLNDLASAYMIRGRLLSYTKRYNDALVDFKMCIQIMGNMKKQGIIYDENDLASAYNNHGVVNEIIGNYSAAILDYSKSIEISEKLNNKEKLDDFQFLTRLYNKQGELFAKIGKNRDAIIYYSKCVELSKKYLYRNGLFDHRYLISKYDEDYDVDILLSGYRERSISYFRINQYSFALSDCNMFIQLLKEISHYFLDNNPTVLCKLAYALYIKAEILFSGFCDVDSALNICNSAILLFESHISRINGEESIQDNSKNVLDKLYQLRELLSPGFPPFPPSASVNPS